MAKGGDNPFSMSDMMQQSFDQSRKAMESCIDILQINLRASPLFASSDLNKKLQRYMEKNIAAASEFAQKLAQAKDFSEYWRIQSEFMEAQWRAFNEQTRELGETVTKGATGARKDSPS